MDCYVYCLLIFLTAFIVESESRPTFIDVVPGPSQVKYLFLYAIRKKDQANENWANFKNTSHLMENVRHLDKSIPIVGHIVAAIFKYKGDTKRAEEILASANKGALILGGMLLAGPPGAIAGAVAGDTVNSVMLQKSVGVIDNIVHFEEKSASDHIDAVLELAFTGAMAKVSAKSVGTGIQNIKKTFRIDMKPANTKSPSGKRVTFNDEIELIPPEDTASAYEGEFRANMNRYGAIPKSNEQSMAEISGECI